MTKYLVKTLKTIRLLILILVFIVILCKSKVVNYSFLEAIYLFINYVFPSMFIFYTFSDLLVNYGILRVFDTKLFRIISKFLGVNTNCLFIIFNSMITGFPSGSKYIVDFIDKGLISNQEAKYLLTFTHFSNPLFIISILSSIYNTSFSLKILISHYFSNILICILLRPKNNNDNFNFIKISKKPLVECLNGSFNNTISTALIVLSNTIVFIVLGSILCSFFVDINMQFIIFSLFDLTKSLIILNSTNYSLFFKGIIICTLLSINGININMQVKSIIKRKKLLYSYFISGRIISASISVILFIILSTVL